MGIELKRPTWTGNTSSATAPVQIAGIANAASVVAGQYHSTAILNDGSVVTWGSNSYGQMGDGTTANALTPEKVASLPALTSITASNHNLALSSAGELYVWGANSSGQLASSPENTQSSPVQLQGLTFASQVQRPTIQPPGGYFIQPPAAVIACPTSGASLYYSTDGSEPTQNSQQIASGSSLDASEIFLLRAKAFATGMDPSAVCSSAFEIGPKVVVGVNHALALKADGTVWAWGDNSYGELGIGSLAPFYFPTQVTALSSAQAVSAGYNFSVALGSDGTVWSWGYNVYGQLGDGTTTQRNSPVQVPGLTGITAISVDISMLWRSSRMERCRLGATTVTANSATAPIPSAPVPCRCRD